ncbi:MAG TPA: Spy/CpxP family protein refolding chaperone [Candidatus Binatia bacterium]|jgi:Spy/CpxP family protein refolding chaperone|nr:Spy/CpxP family protein refolding chaperone [Candidatus Binatia bacterium]
MTRRISASAVVALTLATGALAFAHGRFGGPPSHREMLGGPGGVMYGRLMQALDLTPEQTQKMRDVLKAHHEKLERLRDAARNAHEALAEKLFSTGTLDPHAVDAVAEQAAKARADLMREGLAVALELRGILTPAQLERAARIHTRMKALRAEMRQLLGPPPPGE